MSSGSAAQGAKPTQEAQRADSHHYRRSERPWRGDRLSLLGIEGAQVAIPDVNDDTGETLAVALGAHCERCNVADAALAEHAVVGVRSQLTRDPD